MAKTIRLGSANIIELELLPVNKQGRDASLVWASGRLLIAGEAAIADEHGVAVEWTWLDLLECLAKHWSALLLEQSYPFNLSTLGMSTLMRDLSRRWEDMPEELVENEEEQALQFLARHDLTSGFKGIFFPSVYLMRLGQTLEVTLAQSDTALSLSFDVAIEALEKIANGLTQLAQQQAQLGSRAQAAIELWQKRKQDFNKKHLELATGLSKQDLESLNASHAEFWELNPENSLEDTELMAAARMTNGKLTIEQQAVVLQLIRNVPLQMTTVLDQLSCELRQEFTEKGQLYDQGYWAAGWLRKKLNMSADTLVQPRALLNSWKVKLKKFELENSGLDALACWGKRHGPAILINQVIDSSAGHEFGENSTLAHEICHLLLDRTDTLPVAEVLNGNSPERLEKRARAFAAELLLPRATVADAVQESSDLKETIVKLSNRFKVSEKLVSLQVVNSSIYMQLTQQEKNYLSKIIEL